MPNDSKAHNANAATRAGRLAASYLSDRQSRSMIENTNATGSRECSNVVHVAAPAVHGHLHACAGRRAP